MRFLTGFHFKIIVLFLLLISCKTFKETTEDETFRERQGISSQKWPSPMKPGQLLYFPELGLRLQVINDSTTAYSFMQPVLEKHHTEFVPTKIKNKQKTKDQRDTTTKLKDQSDHTLKSKPDVVVDSNNKTKEKSKPKEKTEIDQSTGSAKTSLYLLIVLLFIFVLMLVCIVYLVRRLIKNLPLLKKA